MLLGDIGREAGGTSPATDDNGHVLKVISAALFCVA